MLLWSTLRNSLEETEEKYGTSPQDVRLLAGVLSVYLVNASKAPWCTNIAYSA